MSNIFKKLFNRRANAFLKKSEIRVIPVINAESFEDVKAVIDLIKPFSNWAHIDVADGTFTKNTLWHDPKDLIAIRADLNLEIHLMILNPEEIIEEWFQKNVKRIIFNLESSKAPEIIINECHKNDIEVGISIGPDTSIARLQPFLGKIDLAQILAVRPGFAGQEFIYESLDKIKNLRKICDKCKIEVDGGINDKTARKIKEAGADILVSASYIFSGNNIEERIKILENI